MSWTPKRSSNPRISDSGTAEPPAFSSRRLERSGGGSSSRMLVQIVGTPALQVTPSAAIKAARPCGVRSGPGRTWRAPTIVATYGMPHAIAWNIGTTGIAESASRIPIESGSPARVAHGRRRVLVELRKLERGIARGHELLVVQCAVALAGAVRHQDLALDCLEARHRLRERGIEEDDAVPR